MKRSCCSLTTCIAVGGTSGIGESTAREFVRYTTKPRIYLIGRSQEQADAIKNECQQVNPESQINFIQSDVSLLRNVDKACEQIKAKEDKVNLLFLSAGFLTMKGRDETSEGLDKKLSLHYYSRLRFTQNLLPLLNKAAEPTTSSIQPLARALSVLGAGLEKPLNAADLADLSLKSTYSLGNCANHAITMTTLSFHTLAKTNPRITFIHSQPGGVETNITRGLGAMGQLLNKSLFIFKAFGVVIPAQESGERHLWASTTDEFGKGGVVLVGQSSTAQINPKVEAMTKDGTEEKVWRHTQEVFDKICQEDGSY